MSESFDKTSRDDRDHQPSTAVTSSDAQVVTLNGNSAILREWLPAQRTANEFGDAGVVRVVGSTIKRRLEKQSPLPPSISTIGANNNATTLFHTSDSLDAVADLAELDQLNRRLDSSGTIILQPHHFNPEKPHPKDTATPADVGKTFATLPTISASLGVSEPVSGSRSQDVRRIVVRLVTGKTAFAYEVEPIRSRLKTQLIDIRESRKVQVDKNGYYIDERPWCTINAFWDSLSPQAQAKTSIAALKRRANSECQSLDALDRERRPKCKVFPLDELQKISILTNKKVVGPDGTYQDPKTGKQWAAFKKWLSLFRVSKRALDYGIEQAFGGLKGMTRLPVLDATRKEVEMLEKEDVKIALAYIFKSEILEVNGVHTEIEVVGEDIRESVFVTMNELTDFIPFNRLKPAYMKSHLEAYKVEALERKSGLPLPMYSLKAATDKFHDRIADIISAMEKTDVNDDVNDAQGRHITIAKFLSERPIANQRKFIANTDQAKRIRRMNSQNEITYLYLESDLENAAKSVAA